MVTVPVRDSRQTGGDRGTRTRRRDRIPKRVDVVGTVVPLAVDEEGRGAGNPTQISRVDVLRDTRGLTVVHPVVLEAAHVETQLPGIPEQVGQEQVLLTGAQPVVHRPERDLRG